MGEYLYILSNPAVPGLIKIGKAKNRLIPPVASKQPNGDSVPLALEFGAEVSNGERSEKAAHEALKEFRVSPAYKFFRTSAPHALEIILPLIGEYTSIDLSFSAGAPRSVEDKMALEHVATQMAKDKADKEARKKRRKELEAEIALEKRNLRRLGTYPVREHIPRTWFALIFCFSPFPIGWIFWLGMALVFHPEFAAIGYVCIGLIIAGAFVHKVDLKTEADFKIAIAPFPVIEEKITALEHELRMLILPKG